MFENKCGSNAPNSSRDNTIIREPKNEDAAFQELLYKKKPRASVYRSSRQEEIKTLRAKASILDARVQDLQFKRAKRRKSKSTISSSIQKLWQRVAFSQLDHRRKAETETILLRDMVRIQILEAKNLRRILKRRTRIESMETALGLKGVKKLLKDTPTGSQHDFQLLLHEADQQLVPMEDFFTTRGIDNLPYTGYVLDVNLDVIDGVYCELLLKRLLPFGIHQTEDAVCDCTHSPTHLKIRDHAYYPFQTYEGNPTLRPPFDGCRPVQAAATCLRVPLVH
ncbi:hypothetical protein PHMEG_00019277 [Phytophthora megakarya]|uniref:Uncharacterized protein n=1 Tax=Phytophthora megakarya TaxID=4795 RepID=A0A225VTG2_9STRA|nr:hypothetical protein PHMEG_00019277 [Phytophthora megakarya]